MIFYVPYLRYLPAITSAWFLISLWRDAELFGWQEACFVVWFVAALFLQLFAWSANTWVTGLVAQVVLAIVLVLKDRIDHIY